MKHLKITSVLLSVTMCASMVMTPVSVFADETTETSAPQTTEATEKQELKETEKPAPKETDKKPAETKTQAPAETKKEEPAETTKQEPEESEKQPAESEKQETEETETQKPSETEEQKPTEATEPSETDKQEPSETEETKPSETETQAPEETEPQIPEESLKAPEAEAKKPAANSVIASGTCGDDLTWELEDYGDLKISGKGKMYDYPSSNNVSSAPWKDYAGSIKAVYLYGDVTYVGAGAFYGCSSLESVFSTAEIIEIGSEAFFACSSLERIDLYDGVTKIGRAAFSKCEKLTNIRISRGITILENETFFGSGLKNVLIPDGVTKIGEKVFGECGDLKSIHISKSVTSIGKGSFINCTGLSDVYYGGTEAEWKAISIAADNGPLNSATKHFSSALASGVCGASMNWVLDEKGKLTITGSGDMSFDDQYGNPWKKYSDEIKTIEFSGNITSISASAFMLCRNLNKVTLPNTLKSIGDSAFVMCKSLSDINIPDTVTSIGSCAFLECENLKSITLPKGLTSIEGQCFEGCGFTELVIPDGVKEIGARAFWGTPSGGSLTKVIIPASVEKIGNGAFAVSINSNTEVFYLGTADDWKKINIADGNDEWLNRADILISGSYYTITLNPVANGKAIISRTNSSAGKEINVKAYPDNGYLLDVIKVNGKIVYENKYAEGPWIGDSTGKYYRESFTMPAENAVVEVIFAEKVLPENTLKVTGKTAKVKYKKLRKKKQNVARSKVMAVSWPQGKVTYKLLSVNKKKKYFKVNAANGVVTIKKKLKKGTYTLKVSVTAAGNENYKSKTQTVAFKIKVK